MDAQTLIKSSLRLFGGIRRGFTPKAEDMNEGLEALNMLIGSWSAEKLIIPWRTQESFTPSAAAASFTIGSGGDFDTTRPMSISDVFLRDSGGTDYPVTRMTQDQYNNIADKDITALPRQYWYRPEYPLGVLVFDSVLDTTYDVHISSFKPLSQIATLTTALSLPDEYLAALKFNLAPMLAPEYGKDVSQSVMFWADDTKKTIENLNASNRVPESEIITSGPSYNIFADR